MLIKIESLESVSVIYALRCKVNHKIYIGKAKNYFLRLGQHIDVLSKNKHYCKLLQEDFNSYGINEFSFEILHILDNTENLDELERKYISSFDASQVYNSNLTENKIVSYDIKTGEILEIFFNIKEASIKTGVDYTAITLCCSEYSTLKATKGIGFCNESDRDKIPERLIDNRVGSIHRKGAIMSIEARRKISEGNKGKRNVPVIQVDKKTHEEIRTFESMKQASIETGINQVNISYCCTGRLKSAGGYIWRYAFA